MVFIQAIILLLLLLQLSVADILDIAIKCAELWVNIAMVSVTAIAAFFAYKAYFAQEKAIELQKEQFANAEVTSTIELINDTIKQIPEINAVTSHFYSGMNKKEKHDIDGLMVFIFVLLGKIYRLDKSRNKESFDAACHLVLKRTFYLDNRSLAVDYAWRFYTDAGDEIFARFDPILVYFLFKAEEAPGEFVLIKSFFDYYSSFCALDNVQEGESAENFLTRCIENFYDRCLRVSEYKNDKYLKKILTTSPSQSKIDAMNTSIGNLKDVDFQAKYVKEHMNVGGSGPNN